MVKVKDDDALDGGIAPLQKFVDFHYEEGKSLAWGFGQYNVNTIDVPDDKERESRRAMAAKELVNIDQSERNRRKIAGIGGLVLSSALYVGLLRRRVSLVTLGLSTFFPVSLSVALIESSRKGLWNVAQKGLWDVDGSGLQKIQDRNIAQAILDRTMALNKEIGVKAVALTIILLALPKICLK